MFCVIYKETDYDFDFNNNYTKSTQAYIFQVISKFSEKSSINVKDVLISFFSHSLITNQ